MRVPALAPAAVVKAEAPVAAIRLAPVAKAETGWSTQRKVALGVGGVGVAGVVLGAVFGAMTLSKTSAAKDHCATEDPPQCDPEGLRLHEDAKTTANVSNVGLAVGGAAVIGGVVLFLTAPAGEAAAPAPGARGRVLPVVGMGSTGVLLQGVW